MALKQNKTKRAKLAGLENKQNKTKKKRTLQIYRQGDDNNKQKKPTTR